MIASEPHTKHMATLVDSLPVWKLLKRFVQKNCFSATLLLFFCLSVFMPFCNNYLISLPFCNISRVFLSFCLSVYLSLCLSVSQSFSRSFFLQHFCVFLFLCFSVFLSTYLYFCPSATFILSLFLSLCLCGAKYHF